jgi:hypothetical protein
VKRSVPTILASVSAVAALTTFAACKTPPDEGEIQIITVDDPFIGPPAATTLDVDGIDADGGVTSLVHAQSVSQSTIDMGDYDESATYAIRVTAFGADGGALAIGETLPVELGALSESVLDVFVQRKGALARLPGSLDDGRNAPLVGVLGGRYIFEAGGTDTATATTTNLYDLIAYASFEAPPSFTTAPQSIALSDLEVLSIDGSGGTWLDLTTGDTTAAVLPTAGPGWADVAGGLSVLADDGTVFIVGATRATGPTAAVLVVSTTQTLAWATLNTARAGAAAGWVSGLGLVVAGGSADPSSAGAELLGAAASKASSLPYPPDPTTGGGLDALDSSHALLVAGSTARVLDLSCAASSDAGSCVQTWTPTLTPALAFAQVFDIDSSSAFIVGEDATGANHAFRLSSTASQPVAFKIARNHARAVRLPLGPVAVVGGNVVMESFTP